MDDDAGNNEGGGTSGGNEGMVPSSRLREEARAKKQALARVVELEGKVQDLEKKTATVDTLTARVRELETAQRTSEAAWADERAVYQAGITDPEAIEVARHLHGRLPEKDRPAFPDWVKAAAADPSKAPKALQAYFGTEAAGGGNASSTTAQAGQGGGQGGAGQGTQARNMGANRGSASSSGANAGDGMTVELAKQRITELAEEGQRTGNWDAYDKERPALLARISRG